MLEIKGLSNDYDESTLIKAVQKQGVQLISCNLDRNHLTHEPDGKAHLRIRGTEGDRDMIEHVIKNDLNAEIGALSCGLKKNEEKK